MAEPTIISWNFANWITIVIMAIIGFLVLVVIAQLFHSTIGTQPKVAGDLTSGSEIA